MTVGCGNVVERFAVESVAIQRPEDSAPRLAEFAQA
jgi:hypothetical protein